MPASQPKMLLVGCHRLSRRGVEEIAGAVFDVPVSLGSIGHLEEQMSQALAPAHAEAVAVVPAAEVKHADETRGRQAGMKRWLWLAATATVAAFVVPTRRRLAGLQALRGETILGMVISDRWKVYEVQTLRLQGRPVLTYLYDALCAHRQELPAPKLLPAG